MGDLTKADLIGLRDHVDSRIDALRNEQNEDFREVKDRLRQINGSVARHDTAIAVDAQRIVNLEKEVFERPRRDPAAASSDSDAQPALTKGDLKKLAWAIAAIAGAVSGVIAGVLETAHKLGLLQ